MTTTKVGSFTLTDGTLEGPADFMRSEFPAVMARINSGQDVVFNYGASRVGEPGFAASVEVALLVAVQTAYAGWHGAETFFRSMERSTR